MLRLAETTEIRQLLKCGCELHFDGHGLDISFCRLHAGAGAMRNALRWLNRNETWWVPLPDASERIRQALAAVGDPIG
jgi:hypothetical protein